MINSFTGTLKRKVKIFTQYEKFMQCDEKCFKLNEITFKSSIIGGQIS